ncbi:type VI secretion system-associated protein TagF [Aquincola sp. MAHUQ-54]|uniref:Type VI secretion system-associated protein TagF n=1 Tax=Aquincola agrisoli TaxID=3119538 RepID=A0AAW9Q445_9BURK
MTAAGWHGKLPTLGDFASRRLDAGFIQRWDAWLSEGLASLQQAPGWLDGYLASPSWRFLLMPGVVDDHLWAGVLMPSVDRVGRYYPLTIAQPLPGLPADGEGAEALWRWLLRLDEAAADALHEDWSLDTLEAELGRIGLPLYTVAVPPPAAPPAGVQALPLAGHRHAASALAALAAASWPRQAQGTAYWYADADLAAPQLLQSAGLDLQALPRRLFGAAAGEAPPVNDNRPAGP